MTEVSRESGAERTLGPGSARTVEDVLGVLVTIVLVGVIWIISLLLTR
jgi:hypothetical protein